MLRAITDSPDQIAKDIAQKISDGDISSWSIEGKFLYFEAAQWEGFAKFTIEPRPEVDPSRLFFRFEWIKKPEQSRVKHCWAAWHSDLAQMLIVHFSDRITDIRIEPNYK